MIFHVYLLRFKPPVKCDILSKVSDGLEVIV